MFQVHWTDTTGKKHRARTLQIESTDDHSGQEPSVLDRRLDRREVGMKFGAETPTEELLARVLEEASTSDLLLGESPETSSPLGRLRRESIAEWKRKVEDVQGSYWWDIDPNQDALLETGEPLANHLSVIRMRIGSRVMGAMVFATSAFMAPIDVINEEATSVEVIYRPYTVTQIAEFDDYHQALRREISHHRVRRTLVWRLYIGSNTDCIDGTTPEENDGRYVIELGRTERAGFLVGRIAFSVNRVFGRDAKDPTAKLRRRLHENELRQGTANPFCCEDIADVANHATAAAVIAVHGHNGLRGWIGGDPQPIGRPFLNRTPLRTRHMVNDRYKFRSVGRPFESPRRNPRVICRPLPRWPRSSSGSKETGSRHLRGGRNPWNALQGYTFGQRSTRCPARRFGTSRHPPSSRWARCRCSDTNIGLPHPGKVT
jgi:hypothetical protein